MKKTKYPIRCLSTKNSPPGVVSHAAIAIEMLGFDEVG